MTTTLVQPYKIFTDLSGNPLENGKVYIGTANLNPISNPISVYWDEDLTIPVAQPIRTISGYLSQNGTPGRLYVAVSDYSIIVRDKNDKQVISLLSQPDLTDANLFTVIGTSGGTLVKTIALTERSGALIEVYGAGLKGSEMSIAKAVFSIYRIDGVMTINKIESEDMADGGDTAVWFEMTASGNNALIKAHADSGAWNVSGKITTSTNGTVTIS